MEALSKNSLVGVPAPSSLEIDEWFGCRETEILGRRLETVEEGVITRGVTTSDFDGAAILKVLGVFRGNAGWETEGFKAGKSVGETTGLTVGVSEEGEGFGAIEMFNIPGIDFFSIGLVEETVAEGPVGIFLTVVTGDLIAATLGAGVDESMDFPAALLLSSAGKSSD